MHFSVENEKNHQLKRKIKKKQSSKKRNFCSNLPYLFSFNPPKYVIKRKFVIFCCCSVVSMPFVCSEAFLCVSIVQLKLSPIYYLKSSSLNWNNTNIDTKTHAYKHTHTYFEYIFVLFLMGFDTFPYMWQKFNDHRKTIRFQWEKL